MYAYMLEFSNNNLVNLANWLLLALESPQFTTIITRVHPWPSGAMKSITEVFTVHQTAKHSAESDQTIYLFKLTTQVHTELVLDCEHQY